MKKFDELALSSRCDRVLRGTSKPKFPSYAFRGSKDKLPSLVSNKPSDCTVAVTKTYTGTAMLGISTLHKSVAVPVFQQQDAIDIARMRR